MVIKVTKDKITQFRGDVSDFGFLPWVNIPPSSQAYPPKYHTKNGQGDPYAQIDLSTEIPSCDGKKCNYREDGY
jgi:ribonuclease Z